MLDPARTFRQTLELAVKVSTEADFMRSMHINYSNHQQAMQSVLAVEPALQQYVSHGFGTQQQQPARAALALPAAADNRQPRPFALAAGDTLCEDQRP